MKIFSRFLNVFLEFNISNIEYEVIIIDYNLFLPLINLEYIYDFILQKSFSKIINKKLRAYLQPELQE